MERTWVTQRIERGGGRLRFYSPFAWSVAGSVVTLAVCIAWCEFARREVVPIWTTAFPILITAAVLTAAVQDFRRSPRGTLHFQIDRENIRFGGIAFRPDLSVPHSAVKMILIGGRYLDLVDAVLFEIHSSPELDGDLRPHLAWGVNGSWIVRSYRGMSPEEFGEQLRNYIQREVEIVRFDRLTDPTQLAGLLS